MVVMNCAVVNCGVGGGVGVVVKLWWCWKCGGGEIVVKELWWCWNCGGG